MEVPRTLGNRSPLGRGGGSRWWGDGEVDEEDAYKVKEEQREERGGDGCVDGAGGAARRGRRPVRLQELEDGHQELRAA